MTLLTGLPDRLEVNGEVKIVTFTIPGRPSGKGRPRASVNKKTGHAMVHSPDVGNFQAEVKRIAIDVEGMRLHEGPVELHILIMRRIPKSWPKWKQAAWRGNPATGTPDGVNVSAAIHDALQGIAYHNDAQVSTEHRYHIWADRDATRIGVKWLEQQEGKAG